MKKFFGEFKKFITRGSAIDMSVGVIIGAAFNTIVTSITTSILKPLIDWVLSLFFKNGSFEGVMTMLKTAWLVDENGKYVKDSFGNYQIDYPNSIYIDWGSVIMAVINFLLTAIVLFIIVKSINSLRGDDKLSKEDKTELKKRGINKKDKKAVEAYLNEKAEVEAQKAKQERLENPTAEDLLKQILAVMKNEKIEDENEVVLEEIPTENEPEVVEEIATEEEIVEEVVEEIATEEEIVEEVVEEIATEEEAKAEEATTEKEVKAEEESTDVEDLFGTISAGLADLTEDLE